MKAKVDCFVRHKDDSAVLFLTNLGFLRLRKASLESIRPRDVADLRAGVLRAVCERTDMPVLPPSECRIFMLMP